MKPLLIFEGTGQRIPDREKRQYDPRVVVKFQENAWCNEEMTVFWLRKCGRSQTCLVNHTTDLFI